MSDESDTTQATPALVVVRGGEPTPEELAALVVALGATAPAAAPGQPPRSRWAERGTLLRRRLEHGPGRWVASTRSPR